ncbi:MAG: acetate--CoA ligase family protein [Desulfobacteraceae bacterium]|jgi:hypothetical protein
MLNPEIRKIIEASRNAGWIVEPKAKRILQLSGIKIAPYGVAADLNEAEEQAAKLGFPLAAKVVSLKIMHKSDMGGVVLGIKDSTQLSQVLSEFQKMEGFQAMHLEPMAKGVELIIGAKNDFQFGPVILLGMGGTGVEIYQDVALRMAPITSKDVHSMLNCLKARKTLEGYRGTPPINIDELVDLLLKFSDMTMTLQENFESIDLNPVLCGPDGCTIVDARIILKNTECLR